MVVLSACDTGVGKEEKGYGVKSLANGFFFAGAKSVVMSLWRVDDYSTSIIMKNYYQNLKEGQSKDDALKNAKLQYLEQVEDEQLKHPYYWAGFVVSGDVSPLGESDYWVWILAGSALLGALLLFRNKLIKRFQ
jgi:CHAT domain-containing protein